jgi:hypothetical protein
MINKLNEIKKLRRARKLVADEELKRLEKNHGLKNRSDKVDQKMENIKKKINRLEKDLENLTILENKFKEKS